MPFLDRLPNLDKCCGCVTDLKTAAAIIAVLGIVTSPVISWAIVRHAYVVRVSCAITTKASNPDVVNINLNNALSFGFGANAGLGKSCLSKKDNSTDTDATDVVQFIKYSGWIVLLADIVFLFSSINLITKIFKGDDKMATQIFLVSGIISVVLTFIYGMLYVATCLYVGGSFPVLEFLFAFIDLIIWMHLLTVMNSYYRLSLTALDHHRLSKIALMILGFLSIYGFLTNYGILTRRRPV